MKKRVSAIILALSMLMCLSISVSAADNDSYLLDGSDDATVSIPMEYSVPNYYSIKIPKKLDASTSYIFSANIMNLATEDTYVLVTVSNLDEEGILTFTHDWKDATLPAFFQNPGVPGYTGRYPEENIRSAAAIFHHGDLTSGLEIYWDFPEFISGATHEAGRYTATAEFEISVGVHTDITEE